MARRKNTEDQTVKKQTTSSISSIANQNIKKKTGYSATASGKTSQITEAANREIKSRQQNARVKEYLEGIKKRQSEKKTKFWQEQTAKAQQSPDGVDRSYQVYAAKLMSENPGSLEKEQQRERRNATAETKKMQKLAQDLQYGYGGRYDPSLAYQAAQQGVKADTVRGIVNKTEKEYSALDNLMKDYLDIENNKEYNALKGLTYQGVKDNRQKNNTGYNYTLEQDFAQQAINRENQQKGLMNRGNDPFWMNDTGRQIYKDTAEKKAESLRDQIKEYEAYDQDAALSGLYEKFYQKDLANEQAILDNPVWKGTKEETAAQTRKAELESGYNAGWREATEKAQRLLASGDISLEGKTPEEQRQIRRMVYEAIMPDSYDDRIKTKRDQEETYAIIDEYINGLTAPWGEGSQGDAISALERQASAYDSQVKAADEAQQYYDFMDRFRTLADGMDYETGYNENLLPALPKMLFDETVDDYVPEPQGSEIDKAYWYANNWQATAGAKGKLDDLNKYMFIASDPEMLAMFNEFYAKDHENQLDRLHGLTGTNYTEQFLKGLDPYLSTMLVDYQDKVIRSRAEDPVAGIPGRIMSSALNVAGGVAGTLGALTGQKKDSKLYLMSRIVSSMRSQQNEDVADWANRVFGGGGDVAKFMLGVVDSIADNVFAMGTGTALAGKGTDGAKRLVQLIMSGSATSNKMIESLDSGMEPTEAALYAIGDGVIEWLTERYSLERIMGPDIKQLVGNKKALVSFIMRSAGAEGSEEIASDLLNMCLDSILSLAYGHENEITKRYNELVTQYHLTDEQATAQALEEKLRDIGLSGLAGALSGLGMAGSRVVSNAISEKALGNQIQKSESNVQNILESVKGMNQETDSYKLADELSKKIDNGEKLSNYDVGRLAQMAMMESDTQIQEKVHNIIKDKVTEDLKGNSEQRDMAEIITKALEDPKGTEGLTKDERGKLNANHDALQVYYKYKVTNSESRAQLKQELREGTKAETNVERSIAETLTTKKPTRVNIQVTKFATDEDIRQAEGQSQRTNSPREVIVDGKFANVRQVKVEKINDKWQARIELEDGRTVSTSQILATNYGVANVINQAAISPEFFSEKYTNLLMKAQEEGRMKDDQQALDDAARIRIAAYIGNSVPETSLDRKLANEIWMQSVQEHAENGKRNAGALKKGTVKFKGLEYGTKEYNEAVSKLVEPSLRSAVDYVGSIFHAAGLELDMDDMQDPSVYGTYDTKTQGISINLFGQNFTLDGKADTPHNIVVTAGHELTHWLKDNAPAAYKRLEQYVMQQYAKKDYNELVRRLNHFMYQDGLDLEGAIDEIVANSSDQVLGDEETVNHIKQTDAKLFGQIRNFVQNLVEKMKAAIFGMQESASKDARFMLAKGVNRINKLWTGAWDEALTRAGQQERKAETKPAEGQVKNSKAEVKITEDSEGKKLTKEQQEFFKDSKAVNDKGQLVKVYHGTNQGGFTQFIDTDDIGYFFTDDVNVAATYSDVWDEYAPEKAKNWDDVNNLAEALGYSIRQTEDGYYRWFENGEPIENVFYKPEEYQKAMNELNDEFIDQNGKKQNYAVYLNLKDPLIIEGRYSNWNYVIDNPKNQELLTWDELTEEQQQDIADNLGYDVDELESFSMDDYGNEMPIFDVENLEMAEGMTTREWVQQAVEWGHDGVIFRDIMDEGEYGNGMRTSDVYVAINPNQIKSVNNTEPTENNDIRYSHAENTEFMKSFAEQLDDFMNPDIDNAKVFKRDSLVVSAAPKVFTKIGLPRLPVTINQEHINKALYGENVDEQYKDGHMFTLEELKKLPEKIAHPIAIAYDPQSTKQVIVYVDMKSNSGEQVIVPLRIGGIANINNTRNNTLKLDTTMSPINNRGKTLLESAIKLNSEGKVTLFYINKKQAAASGLRDDILNIVRGLDSGLIHSIKDKGSNVKPDVQAQTDSLQFKLWFDKSVIRNEDGSPKIMYHGTLNGGFDVFGGRNDFWYFSDSKDYAKVFAGRNNNNTWAKGIRDDILNGKYKPQVYEVYLSVQNPFVTDDQDIIEDALYWDHTLAQQLRDKGYDALMLKDQSQVIVLNPNQIKSATDNIGTFSKKTNNIKFSMAEPVEERADGLVAVHNLTENNLIDTLTEGGFTAPSIAVVKAQTGHSKFGEISVIFTKDTIDPQRDRGNKIYGADAWTPTRSNAQIETKLDYDKMQEAKKEVKQIMENADPYYAHEAERWIGEKAYNDDTNKTLDEWADQAAFNEGMLAAFMTAEGQEIKKEYRQIKDNQELSDDEKHINMYNGFLDDMERLGYLDQFMETMEKESINFNMEQWGRLLAASTEDKTINKVVDNYFSDDPGLSKRILSSWLRQIYLYERDGRQIKYHDEIDRYKMRETMQNTVDRQKFNKWITKLFSRAFGERGVYNGKDPYFNDGSRRSWKSLHWAPTAENIVKAMYTNHEAKGGEAGGATGLIAKASKEYKNIDQVRQDSSRLQMLDEKEYEEKVKQLDEELNEFISDVADTTGKDYYSIKESLIDAAGQYAKSEKIDWFNYALNDYGIKLEPDQTEKAMELLEKARNIETGYFEAKPERVVGLDEVAKVILPEDTSQELIDKLDKAGIQYETYDGTDEDRLAKLNAVPNVQFSKAEESDAMDAGLWLATVSPWSGLQTEDERYLQEAFKAKRTSISLNLLKQSELRDKIRKMEARETLDNEAQRELENMRDKLEDLKDELAKKEEELQKIQSTSGFAGKMYQQRMLIDDYVAGRTQDQVLDSVESMLKEVEEARKDIAKRTEELKELANTQAVKAMKAYLNKGSLKQQAEQLAETWQTAMPKTEIQDRLAAMALKLANGQDISTDAETLATDMMNTLRGVHNEELESLRGVKLTIGKSLVNELKAENSSLKEIQQEIRGSGIRIIEGEENSRLVEQWNELRNNNQSLPETSGNEIDVLHDIVDYITGQMQGTSGEQVYGEQINMEEVTAAAYVAAASVSLNMVQDPAAKRLISSLMKQIKELSQKQGEIVDNMTALNEKMAEAMSAGVRAKSWANVLQNDVDSAIKYYNEVAKLAAKEEKAKVRKDVAEHLRSENAKKLYEQQEKYQQMLKDSRQARETAEENKNLRNRINTNISRLRKRLTEETDKQNIPEETKALARHLCSKLVNHDMTEGLRHILFADRKQLQDFSERLKRMDAEDGGFNADRDLDWLVIHYEADESLSDYDLRDKVVQDLRNIDNGLLMYWTAEGNGLDSLQNRRDALKEISEAVAEITGAIRARGEAFINNRRYEVADMAERAEDEMSRSKFKGERYGRGSRQKNAAEQAIVYGNMTPVYFIKNLHNSIMSLLYSGLEGAENTNGLMAAKAQERLQKIAEETGFRTWNGKATHELQVNGGKTIKITTEQLMALYATWQREKNNLRPEATAHLLKGGFVLAKEENTKGKPGRERIDQRPVKMSKEMLDKLGDMLTEQQKAYVDAIVEYMSKDVAEVANETSMQTYGIRKFTEKYYFPIKSWRGVLSQESNRGINNQNDNAAMRQSFLKRVTAGAQNAIEIGDFTPTAVKHIVGMINFNTVGPAVEALNRVLNYQLQYGDVTYNEGGEVAEDNRYKRSVRAAFQNAYGETALKYLQQFMQDINGGTAKGTGSTLYDKLLTAFKKNAVAGSLSVAFQQPMSYIRAAMMINPKYLAAGMKGEKGAYEELLKYSGVAVLKRMGKFDMNYGRSMMDYITPEGQQSKAKAAYEWISDKSTALPEAMDAWTWTRMWIAVKAEQKALNPGMDVKSEAFLQKAAERFNELMRRTQVYDSVMVKSQNMRSPHWYMKTITSFMAEPTLTANVLADAFANIKEEGGKRNAAKAVALFMMSAAGQAIIKAFFSAGRSPDKKKNELENYLYKLAYNLFNEANPLGLIPGYSQIVDTIANGELTDNSMSVIAKAWSVIENIQKMAAGQGNWYRNLEDSIGQFVQLATSVPAKNIMRDFRAMVNWLSGGTAGGFTGNEFAQRATSGAVLKYQTLDTLLSEDLIGIINNELLGSKGYETTNAAYHKRLYEAQKANQEGRAKDLKEYLQLGKGVKEETIAENLKKNAKADESLTTAQQDTWMIDNDLMKDSGNITTQYKEGKLTKEEAKKLYKKLNPKLTDNDVWWKLDQLDYQKETGAESVSGYSYRLKDAIRNNKEEAIKKAIKAMLDHGRTKEQVKSALSDWKSEYLAGDTKTRNKIRDALQKAYKALGLTAADADKTIENWKKDKKKK